MPEARETRKPQGYAGPKNPPKKPRSKASPARLAALDVVRAVRERDAFAQDVIGTRIDRSDLSSEDRAFATKLALGVVSATGTLDEIIDRALNAPSDVKPDVRDALRVSTYEIIFLGKTPHAAVDQGVELVRSFAMSASGLANAVLRKIVLMRQAFPFGDPMRDPEALARLHAFPLWLARKLIVDLGPQKALDFMRASNEQAPLFIAVNAAKTSDETLVKAFDKLDEGLDPVSVDGVSVAGCYRVLDTRALLLPEVKRMFSQGKILVTDAASQLVAASVLPERKPASLLEVGAGRATKTILLQSDATRAYGSQLVLSTLDNHAFKTRLLLERAERAGAEVAQLYVSRPNSQLFTPLRELKGFAKVFLQPGESRTVTIPLDDKAFRYWNVKTDRWEVEGGSYQLLVGASSADIRLTAVVTVEGTHAPDPYAGLELPHYKTGEVASVPDAEYEALLGRPLPENKVRIDRNMTLGEMGHGRSPIGWLAAAVLGALLRRSIKNGKPDLNILFQYNMPLRALAKMTNGAISMGMVDGIVMELKGFWIIGLVRVIWEALKNVVLNSRMEERLKNS